MGSPAGGCLGPARAQRRMDSGSAARSPISSPATRLRARFEDDIAREMASDPPDAPRCKCAARRARSPVAGDVAGHHE
jgi:hypothetical protein